MSALPTLKRGLAVAVGLTALWSTSASADDPAPAEPAVVETAEPVPAPAPALEPAPAPTPEAPVATEVTVEIAETPYDGMQQLLDDEARAAMNKGEFRRAWHFFWRLLKIDPDDSRALREAGRVAHALGCFAYAVQALGRYDQLTAGVNDPEIHYLRAEALFALGRKAEAEREWEITEEQLGDGKLERQGVLWKARIAALRGDIDGAVELYLTLEPADRESAEYAEIMLYVVEAHILARDWAKAEKLLRQFRKHQPDHARGREMMAWVLDARGNLDEELGLRAVLADEWTDHPRKTVEYAQALERAYDYPGALDRYREAHALGVEDVSGDIARLEHRVSPEVGAGMNLRTDASGSVTGYVAGATLPIGKRLRVAVSAVRDTSDDGLSMRELTSTAGTGWAILTGKRGGVIAVGATVRDTELETSVGGSAVVQSNPGRNYQIQMRADLNVPWLESSSTVREGGVSDAIGGSVYATPWSRRLLFSIGGQVRRLGLSVAPYSTFDPHAYQLFGAAGVDFTVTSDPSRRVRGEVLDNEMLSPRRLDQATVISYRHYEMSSDDPFGMRLVLVERSSIDEVSGVIRQVLGDSGWAGVEFRGGIGYDRGRALSLWRAGASLLLSATRGSRFTFDYDVASESGTGIAGERSAGSVNFHVDL